MKRVQCLVCCGFMDWTPKRICSEDCQRVMDERNRKTVEMGMILRERQKQSREERKKRRQEVEENRKAKKAEKKRKKRERSIRAQVLKEKVKAQAKQVRALKQGKKPNGFYETREWQSLRYQVLRMYGRKCMCCGATDCELHVDHIKPRSKYPNLELSIDNLQVLCRSCNMGKSNLDETDWRPHKQVSTA